MSDNHHAKLKIGRKGGGPGFFLATTERTMLLSVVARHCDHYFPGKGAETNRQAGGGWPLNSHIE